MRLPKILVLIITCSSRGPAGVFLRCLGIVATEYGWWYAPPATPRAKVRPALDLETADRRARARTARHSLRVLPHRATVKAASSLLPPAGVRLACLAAAKQIEVLFQTMAGEVSPFGSAAAIWHLGPNCAEGKEGIPL